MATNTLSTLLTRLSQRIGDFLEETVTTAINADNLVVCTTLGDLINRDDYYNRRWIYFTDEDNATVYRKVSDYATSSTTITVRGAVLTDDGTDLGTFQLHTYDRRNKIRAINLAARKIWPYLFRIVRDTTLISNNIIPNSSFEDWTASTSPDYWTTLSGATAVVSTAVGTYRGIRGSSSIKLTDSGSGAGYIELNSDTFPKLLDLMGKTVSLYVWCSPQTADDGAIVIYTKQADTTAQTLTSPTATPAGEFTLIKLEDQALNDDLVEVKIRLGVTTASQYAYFDNFRITGINVKEYLLPLDFQNPLASIDRVSIQTSGTQDKYVDDLLSYAQFEPLYGCKTVDDATTKYLVTPTLTTGRLLQLEGRAPLESNLSVATSTMTIEDPHMDLLIELAASILFDMEAGLPSSQDRDYLREQSLIYRLGYEDMKRSLKMIKPQSQTLFDWRIL